MTVVLTVLVVIFGAGLAVFLYALRRRLLARMERGFLVTLMLAVGGSCLVTATLLGAWGYSESRGVLFQDNVDELHNVGTVLEGDIHDGIEFALQRVKNFGATIAPDVVRGNRERLREKLQTIEAFNRRFVQMNVMDSRGVVLASGSIMGEIEKANRIGVAFNLDGQPFASDAYISPVFKRYVVYLAVPIEGPDKSVIGAISVRYDLQNSLSRTLAHTRFGQSAYTMVATSEGRVLAHPVAERINDDVSSYTAVQRALKGETGWVLEKNKANQERLMAYRPIKSPATLNPKPWALVTEMDASEVIIPIHALRNKFALATLLLVAVGLVVAGQVSRSIQRPVGEILTVVRHVRDGDLTVHSAVTGHDEIGRMSEALNEMVHGLQERDRVKEVFGRYVTTQVSEEILKGQLDLGGAAKLVTILFSDVRNFTTMSEAMTPEQVVAFLNDYFTEMVDAVFEQNGVLDKFMGDGILAVFGSVDDSVDHPRRAVLAALRMQARLAKINGERAIVGKPPIAIGIGIHTAEVIVGNIGSRKRLEYTVVGDGVNTCSRVESANKELGTTLLITETTYAAVQNEFECKAMPEAHLKGKFDVPRLYEVMRHRPGVS